MLKYGILRYALPIRHVQVTLLLRREIRLELNIVLKAFAQRIVPKKG